MTSDPTKNHVSQLSEAPLRDLLLVIISGQEKIHQSNQEMIRRQNALLKVLAAIAKS